MIQNYLAIVSRFEFNDLYKYGHMYLTNHVPLNGTVHENGANEKLFAALTSGITSYESSSDYLILHIVGDNLSAKKEIYIAQVAAVYTLDEEAKARLSTSFDPRIHLEVSPWANLCAPLCAKLAVMQAKIGIHNCFQIFDIPEDDQKTIESILPENLIPDLFSDFFAKKRPDGEQSIWTYLVRYQRHSPYWNCIKGFFSDAIHAYENYAAKHEIDDDVADSVELGMAVNACDNADSFDAIYSKIREENCDRYQVEHCTYMATAPLYLYMRSLFTSSGISRYADLAERNIDPGHLYRTYGFDFSLAVFLLGLTLGQEQTYGAYYEKINLNLFNPPKEGEYTLAQVPSFGRPFGSEQRVAGEESAGGPSGPEQSTKDTKVDSGEGDLLGKQSDDDLARKMQCIEAGIWPENCRAIVMKKINKDGSVRKNAKGIEVYRIEDVKKNLVEKWGIIEFLPGNPPAKAYPLFTLS